MADLISKKQNANSKQILSKTSDVIGATTTALQLGGFILGKTVKNIPFISVPFEMAEDGPIKGLVSGTASSFAGTVGAGLGLVAGARLGGLPGAIIGAIGSSYVFSKGADDFTDKLYDKYQASIKDKIYGLGRTFDEAWTSLMNYQEHYSSPYTLYGNTEKYDITSSGQSSNNFNINSPMTLYGYANENSYLGYPTPAFGAEVNKAGQLQEIKLETPSLLETLGLPDMHKENSNFSNESIAA